MANFDGGKERPILCTIAEFDGSAPIISRGGSYRDLAQAGGSEFGQDDLSSGFDSVDRGAIGGLVLGCEGGAPDERSTFGFDSVVKERDGFEGGQGIGGGFPEIGEGGLNDA